MESRQHAADLVAAGRIIVSGSIVDKTARLVSLGEPVEVVGPPPRYVSRGGEKLHAALVGFEVEVADRRALDAGASTGGFTDCLLQHGVRSVTSVDVGRAQLHARLARDVRVLSLERTDIRTLSLAAVGGRPFDLAVADLAFISLRLAIPVLTGELMKPDSSLVLLVKPQFEAGRAEVSKGRGVVRDPAVHRRVLDSIASSLIEHGAAIMGAMPSPITGQSGNIEYFLHALVGGGTGGATFPVSEGILAAVDEAQLRFDGSR